MDVVFNILLIIGVSVLNMALLFFLVYIGTVIVRTILDAIPDILDLADDIKRKRRNRKEEANG